VVRCSEGRELDDVLDPELLGGADHADLHLRKPFVVAGEEEQSRGPREGGLEEARIGEVGFTGYEARVLAALAASGPLSQAEIGHAVSLDPRDVTHTVRALAERGLVARRRHPDDERRMLVELTPTGRRGWQKVARALERVQDEFLEGLTPEEREVFVAMLERLSRD